MTECNDLSASLDTVIDIPSLLSFMNHLRADWDNSQELEKLSPSNPYSANHLGWENVTIGRFLESAESWAVDSDLATKVVNPYRAFAQILMAGKCYE